MTKGTEESQLDWLVDCRSKNQHLSLALHKMLTTNRVRIRKEKRLLNSAQALVAVMFSLWRAVFLSPDAEDLTEDDGQQVLADAEAFLHTVIADNAIGYQQDKKWRNWTFIYYVNNAAHRLERMSGSSSGVVPNLLPKGTTLRSWSDARETWLACHKAAEEAISNLEKAMK